MRYVLLLIFCLSFLSFKDRERVSISKNTLADKIKGGWYGQLFGALHADSVNDHPQLLQSPLVNESLGNDIMLLSVFKAAGLHASRKDFADEIQKTTKPFDHAFAVARWNLDHEMRPPQTGYWTNNPHADDDDFLAAADVLGLISPGLPGQVHRFCDQIGHITNSGDGYYGGLYIATLYALSFTTHDHETMIIDALSVIPPKSKFSVAINDCLDNVAQFPAEPEKAYAKFLKKWRMSHNCPDSDGVFRDSKINSALITMALMYGKGEVRSTFDLLDRFQSPPALYSTIGGILGTLHGYRDLQDLGFETPDGSERFLYYDLSLDEAVTVSTDLAIQNIESSGGKQRNNELIIAMQKTSASKLEKSFEGHCSKENRNLNDTVVKKSFDFEFEGVGFVVKGVPPYDGAVPPRTIRAELYLNNKYIQDINVVADHDPRNIDLVWKLQLPYKKYQASIRLLDPSEINAFKISAVTVYDVPLN